MSVAHDLDALDERKRKDAALELVNGAAHRLHALRHNTSLVERGDVAAWEQIEAFARELIRLGQPLELGLLVACAKEVLHFTARRKAGAPCEPNLVLYLLSGLDTLAMELERLRHDKDLR
jgi:hypothetical protein